MRFEYDEYKSASNAQKHGIDFVAAQQLWEDPDLLVIPARTMDEPRSLAIGVLDGKHWAAIVTERGEALRIISVRRARREEVSLYEGL